MAGDEGVNVGGRLLDDVDDRAGNAVAAVRITVGRNDPFVDEGDDRRDAVAVLEELGGLVDASASGRNFSPTMPDAATIVGVLSSVTPMMPTRTPSTTRMSHDGSTELPVVESTTFAARTGKVEPE